MASLSWIDSTNTVQTKGVSTAMLMLSRSHRLGRHLWLGSILLVGSLNAAAVGKTTPSYTTDLSPWGPHGETILKRAPWEPRWLDLQDAEQKKISACSRGKHLADAVMNTLAMEEATVDIWARHGGPARSRPVGELADEVFREKVESALESYSGKDGWPLPHLSPGRDIAKMYGRHFGYQFWHAYYEPLHVNPLEVDGIGIKMMYEIYEQFWPLCLEQVPTACFEEGPADPRRCLSKLIHPREFPAYEVTSDLFQKYMAKPNAW